MPGKYKSIKRKRIPPAHHKYISLPIMRRPVCISPFVIFFCPSITAQNNDLAQQLIHHVRSSVMNSWTSLAEVLSAVSAENSSESANEDRYNAARKKAMHWLATDEYALSLANDANNNDDAKKKSTQLLQRYALATIYYSTIENGEWGRCAPLSSTTITPCDNDEHRYLSSANHLSWEGINGKNGVITWLDLNTKNLSNCLSKENHVEYDMLPMELTLLSPSLELLWLHSNQICGNLPSFIGEFTNLQSLSVYSTNMSGTIPSSLYQIERLASIRLYKSNFEGRISEDIRNLKNLKWFWIHENRFTGTIPSLGSLTALEGITLNGNKFDIQQSDLCQLRKGNLKYLWSDCEHGSVLKKNEEWVAVEGKKACECCTRCFPMGEAVAIVE